MKAPPPTPDAAVIELHLQQLGQLFHALDPSPFGSRDLDPKAEEFIVDAAGELPADRPLRLVVHLDRPPAEARPAAALEPAVQAYFRRRAEAERRQLRRLFRTGRVSLLISLLFLGAVLGLSELLSDLLARVRLGRVVGAGLDIAAWVALWRPLEIFLYDWWPLRSRALLYERLGQLTVRLAPAPGAPPQTVPPDA
jgi:hypothetical protein